MTRIAHLPLASVLVLSVAALFFVPPVSGQTVAGSISGLITDSSGAAVSGVTVTVTDLDRSVTLRSTSNDAGFYVVAPVPPGRYRIQAEKTGFRRFVLEPLPIATQQKASVPVTLEVGAVSESITVTGSGATARQHDFDAQRRGGEQAHYRFALERPERVWSGRVDAGRVRMAGGFGQRRGRRGV